MKHPNPNRSYTNMYAKVIQTVRMFALFRKHERAVIQVSKMLNFR